MYLISSRKKITDGKRFSEEDRLRYIKGPNTQISVSKDIFLSEVVSQNVLLIVHGFNNPFRHVVQEYLRLKTRWSHLLENQYDYILGYTWPAGNSELDYFQAKKNTDKAAQRIRNWLIRLTNANCTIDIMGHSLAAMVGYKTLKREAPIKIRNVFSFGAAISKDLLLNKGIPSQLLEKIESFYAFYNRNDSILKYCFRLIEWEQALGYAGLSELEEIPKVDSKIHVVDCSEVIYNHTDYTRSLLVSRFLADVLEGNTIDQITILGDYGSPKPVNQRTLTNVARGN
ncbi:DUF726 domain-containing protein [Fodinibius sp. N2]|uniref:DUF726 domain-containing protein n=1 Tax=Fodinibius alkaliphilus TaxID=3140241 RepID=UPI00315A9541